MPGKNDIDSCSVVKMHASFIFNFCFVFLIYFFIFSTRTTTWMDTPVPSTFLFLESSRRAVSSKSYTAWGCPAQELSETVSGNTYRKVPRKRLETTTTTFITAGQYLG
jgi:hypothetical protein